MTRRQGRASGGATPARRRGQRGMVTVELAIGFVTVALFSAVLAGMLLIGVVQASCDRAATEVARQQARGDVATAARVEGEAPDGSVVHVDRQAEGIAVTVTSPVEVFGLGRLTVTSAAWSRWEPGVGP